MKKENLWQLLFATVFSLVMASCASPSVSEEEWNDIGASVASSMKFDVAIEKTKAQAQERYDNRRTLEYWEWDAEECIHEVRLATLRHIVSYFHETSEWEAPYPRCEAISMRVTLGLK